MTEEAETLQANPLLDGWQWRWKFPNGYGASVTRGQYTYGYGGWVGLYEIAVLDKEVNLFTEEDVLALLDQIEEL